MSFDLGDRAPSMPLDAWGQLEGMDLPLFEWPATHKRVVACLNVWQDRHELERNLPTWLPYVDALVAVDGAYAGTDVSEPDSTDGTLELLYEACARENVEFTLGLLHEACSREGVECTLVPAKWWPDQNEKRSEFFRHTRTGDLLLITDADERWKNVHLLPTLPHFDVGWCQYTSPIYLRSQAIPRLVRWQPDMAYRKRHHWIYRGSSLVCTNQQGGTNLVHRRVPLHFHNSRGYFRPADRQDVAQARRFVQVLEEAAAAPEHRAVGHEPLHVVQVAPYDAGNVVFRLHTALNTTSPHASVMIVERPTPDTGEYRINAPAQFYARHNKPKAEDGPTVQELARDADIVHHHVTRYGAWLRTRQPYVMHHHGTVYRTEADRWNREDYDAAIRLVSNLELLQYGENLHYLPNPVPVAEYAMLGKLPWPKDGPLRICHAPTKRRNKGTEAFLEAVQRVRDMGVKVAVHLVERTDVRNAIRAKAACHVTFDSFWLGMQCSGLEAAAIGTPVIAGDPDVKAGAEQLYGYVPYTYANDASELVNVIERLVTDEEYYYAEAARVHGHVVKYHDSAAVAARYLDLLDDALDWRDKLKLGAGGMLAE